ncbi:MAG: ATP-binding protein [Lentisphaeria bacterium]
MIPRLIEGTIRKLAKGYPAIAITGPRQSGKTTLAVTLFPDKPYLSLENPDLRTQAKSDPRGFLASCRGGAILDEIQRCPDLFSYLQEVLDLPGTRGKFILTGSQQFGLRAGIAQSLAGRVGMVELPPFTVAELADRVAHSPWEAIWKGFYPPLFDRPLDPPQWYSGYIQTYLERDVRQITQVHDLDTFQRFIRLCAGRSGQLLNHAALAADTGISQPTAKAWLSILQASYVVFLLPPLHRNFNKRIVKSHKLYFYDTGLACQLLGIRTAVELEASPFRGALFENLIVADQLKRQFGRGLPANLYFWRDNVGHEVDLLLPAGPDRWTPVEIKSGQTVAEDWFGGLRKWHELAGALAAAPLLVYGGDRPARWHGVTVRPWRDFLSSDKTANE